MAFSFSSNPSRKIQNTNPMKRVPKTSKCSVCGAPSKYINYNAEACDACKQFFRRIVVCKKLYQCRRDGECDLQTAKIKCRSCRLDRCLVEGMDCAMVELQQTPDTKAFRALLIRRGEKAVERLRKHSSLLELTPTTEESVCPVLGHLRIVEGKSRHFLKTHLAFREGFLEQFGSLKELLSFGQNIMCNFEKFAVPSTFTPVELSSETIPIRPVFVRAHPFITEMIEAFEFFRMAPIVSRLDTADQLSLLCYVGFALYHISLYYRSFMHNSVVATDHNGGIPLLFFRKSEHYGRNMIVQRLADRISLRPMELFNAARLSQEEYLLLRAIIVAHPASPGLSKEAQLILQEESERLASILTKMLRRERGDFEGMKRYAELVHLVEVVVQATTKCRELKAYMAVITDPRCIVNNFPIALEQFFD